MAQQTIDTGDTPNQGRTKINDNDTELYGLTAANTTALSTHAAASDPHPVYLTQTEADALYKALGYVPSWTEITGKPSTFAPSSHATTHTNGSDDIQSASASQKGLATASQITKLDGVEAGATGDQSRSEIVGLWTGTPDGTKYLRDDGTLAAPSGGSSYRTLITLGADVANSTTSFTDVTGLSFSVVGGTRYRFYCLLIYDVASTATGAGWAVNGPASPTMLGWRSIAYDNTASVVMRMHNTYDTASVAGSSTFATNNIATLEGIIIPSASGTLIVRFKSETAGQAVTAKASSSMEWW